MTFPTVAPPDEMSEDDKERVRNEFAALGISASNVEEQPAPKRGRGRPPGSKNKRPSPASFTPLKLDGEEREPLPTLENPPLTARDQKEVSKRLQGILAGVSGVASVAKPYLKMTDEEAEAIAIPLTTYLMRRENTSKAAKQILEEYDVAAFVIALAAYVVRVYLDFQAERLASVDQPVSNKRESSPTNIETIRQSGTQSQEGEERPASRELASVSEGGWTPSQI